MSGSFKYLHQHIMPTSDMLTVEVSKIIMRIRTLLVSLIRATIIGDVVLQMSYCSDLQSSIHTNAHFLILAHIKPAITHTKL